MRYNLESTLPIHAFQPLGGRHNPFIRGMTLEGGGGGGFLGGIVDAVGGAVEGIGDVVGGAAEGIGDVIGGAAEGVGDALASVDDFVGDVIPGGWGTVAAVAVPYAAPFLTGAALTASQAAALAAGTSAATGAIQGKPLDQIALNAALAGGLSYGLGSLGEAGTESLALPSETPYVDLVDEGTLLTPNIAAPDYYESISVPSETPYVNAPDGESLLTPDSAYAQPVDPALDSNLDGIRSGDARFGIDPMSATGGRADPLIGVLPTNNNFTDLPVGYEFMGPNGMEIVGPNGKTYLQKDLYESLANLNSPQGIPYESSIVDKGIDSGNFLQDISLNAKNQTIAPTSELNLDALYQDMPDGVNQLSYDPVVQEAASQGVTPNISFDPTSGVKITDYSAPASAETEAMVRMGMLDRMAELPGAAYDMAKSYISANPYTSAAVGLGALTLGGRLMGGEEQQPAGSPAPTERDSRYTGGYGSAGRMYDPYALRSRVNAENIYGYRSPSSRYAEGGEVKRFGLGGLSRAVTRFTQPIEKAVIRPIGNAVPFLREAAPYAGLIAAPFIASPMMAAGVGALSSGFGTPGSGFNMKRAMMGGMAAYGMSNIGAGIEAAGTPSMGTGTGFTSGAVDAALSTPDAATGFFRNPDAMGAGIKNLAGGSTYGPAAAQFATKAGIPSAGMALMGTSGVMAIDEGIKQQAEYDAANAATRGENQEMLNRIAANKKRAQQAVRDYPYQYAMGGSVDDESGMDEARGIMQGNLQKGLFGMGYAAGGMPNLALSRMSQPAFNEGAVGGMPQFASGGQPRFLSGGGDGMSDSIPATIEGNQEARLADGEFVIPADVVSHLGNGSSKAGAKQLYSMMDRVRQARVGNKKQGREIKPKKFMPA